MKIKYPAWIDINALETLLIILGKGTTRLVGGCVRNAIINGPATDIDLATHLTPDQVIARCDKASLKFIPTGLDHGTVTIICKGQNFEVTTLRKDIATDGRHAEVAFTDDWGEDASRRDFTMNALYMDLQGNVFDPLGCGVDDLQARKVRFVGEPHKRIQEDYLRILRFFRFHAQYGRGEIDSDALYACQQAAQQIETLSLERITQEFLKIIASHRGVDVLNIMFENNILNDLPNEVYDPKILLRFVDIQKQKSEFNNISRLFILGGNKPSFFEKYLRLSHAQKKFLIKLEMATKKSFFENEKELKKAIFYHGNDVLVQGYLLRCAIDDYEIDVGFFDTLKNWQAPYCPITGDSLIAEGYQTGPELGQELNRRVEEWLEETI